MTQDGLPLVGNTAATRPRLAVYGYDSTGKVKDAVIDSAFVAVVAEEDKGLGAFTFDADGAAVRAGRTTATPTASPSTKGRTSSTSPSACRSWTRSAARRQDSLLANLTQPGHQLNQPEVDWTTGQFYPVRNTSEFWDFGDYNFNIYNTEIARRGSWLGQDIYKVHKDTSKADGRPARTTDLEAGPDEPGRPGGRDVPAHPHSEEVEDH